jgi:hypothetical protein
MSDAAVLIKMLGTASCDAKTRVPAWRLAHGVAPEASPEQLQATVDMRAIGNYSEVIDPRPIGAGCCLLLPDRRCVDQTGEHGELRDEPVLCERDLGWLSSEEEARAAADGRDDGRDAFTVRPDEGGRQPLSLKDLRAHDRARTLVIELPSGSAPRALRSRWLEDTDQMRKRAGLEDSFALLPRRAEVRRAVRDRLKRSTDRRSTRTCIERLLKIARY